MRIAAFHTFLCYWGKRKQSKTTTTTCISGNKSWKPIRTRLSILRRDTKLLLNAKPMISLLLSPVHPFLHPRNRRNGETTYSTACQTALSSTASTTHSATLPSSCYVRLGQGSHVLEAVFGCSTRVGVWRSGERKEWVYNHYRVEEGIGVSLAAILYSRGSN